MKIKLSLNMALLQIFMGSYFSIHPAELLVLVTPIEGPVLPKLKA